MSSQFVVLPEPQFDDWANQHLPGHTKTQPVRGVETVYCWPAPDAHGLEIHVYSTLENGVTRARGTDAIRFVLYDRHAGKPLDRETKVLRTDGATTVFERMAERVAELRHTIDTWRTAKRFCTKATCTLKAAKVERVNRTDNSRFFGCLAFPNCNDATKLRNRYPLRANPIPVPPRPAAPPPADDPPPWDTIPAWDDAADAAVTALAPNPHDSAPVVITPIVAADAVVPTRAFAHLNYPFEHFNRVQSAVFQHGFHSADCNLVLGTTTSSGKTIAAELAMAETLAQGRMVVYVSPLKSLTQEKYSDWGTTFAGKTIEILTGDYVLGDAKAARLQHADIICLTSEMLDSYPASTTVFIRQEGKTPTRTTLGWLFEQPDKARFEVLTWRDGTWFWTRPYDWIDVGERDVYRVKMKGGREFVSTECHNANVMTDSGRAIAPIKVKDLVPGEHAVAVMSGGYETDSAVTAFNTVAFLREHGAHLDRVYVTGVALSQRLATLSVEAVQQATGLAQRPASAWKRRQKLPLSVLPQPWEVDVDQLTCYHSDATWPAVMEVDAEWMWTLGFYLAEGSISQQHIMLYQRTQEPLLRAQAAWGGTLREDQNGYHYLDISHPLLRRFLAGCGRNAGQKRVPEFVFGMCYSHITALLDGHRDGDGNGLLVDQSTRVQRTTSEQLSIDLLDLMTLTGHCGARTLDRGTWNVTRRGAGAGRANLPGLAFRSVVSVEHVGREHVYDIAVPDTETFLGGTGAVLLHNSRTRNHDSERSQWMHRVGLVVVDEAHIIATNRGHAVEVGMMRFAQLVPDARFFVLSATMRNIADFKHWLDVINTKPTHVINSDWRPTALDWHFVPYIGMGSGVRYQEAEEAKIQAVIDVAQSKPSEKFLIFVHAKVTGRRIVHKLLEHGERALFHNAELPLDERLAIETDFANKRDGLRLLVSTSTLAWGRTLPARNVIIAGRFRGLDEVDELDFIQMAGRAGRFGVDPKGDVYFVTDNVKYTQRLVANPRPVKSTLLSSDILGFHILAEIKNGVVYDAATFAAWFQRTLAFQQMALDSALVQDTLQELEHMGMMTIDDRGWYRITPLGKISATLYYMPRDVHHWHTHFEHIDREQLWRSDLALAYVLGTTPSMELDYVPRNEEHRVTDYLQALSSVTRFPKQHPSLLSVDVFDWLSGEKPSFLVRPLQTDADRLGQALNWLDGINKWHMGELWTALPIRLQYGVGPELVALCRLPHVGGVRAKKLWGYGVRTLADVLQYPDKVRSVMGKQTDAVVRTARAIQHIADNERKEANQ